MVKRTAPDLHNRLAEFRAVTGISRVDLAKAVGVNPQTIGYLERGDYNPSLVLALALADHFECQAEDLFSLTPFDLPTRGTAAGSANGHASSTGSDADRLRSRP